MILVDLDQLADEDPQSLMEFTATCITDAFLIRFVGYLQEQKIETEVRSNRSVYVVVQIKDVPKINFAWYLAHKFTHGEI